jgi:predicted CoA-substrate-specific enzyme activase
MLELGIDIGSTTAKLAALDETNHIIFSRYKRHQAKAAETVLSFLCELLSQYGDEEIIVHVTGSVGMGLSESCSLPFVQEVVASAQTVKTFSPATRTMIDIGGEDAKIVFFKDSQPSDLRMNGNCAGGTGAFIDQMATLLDIDVSQLNELALSSSVIYPIASRCGVFCKTDIQNLIAKNVCKEDIAASVFHAVAVQTVLTLSHGCELNPPILLCGGPLTFLPALRKAFYNYLSLPENAFILPEHGTLMPAIGAALTEGKENRTYRVSELIHLIQSSLKSHHLHRRALEPIFTSQEDYDLWKQRIGRHEIPKATLKAGVQYGYLGVDSGSTTTKIVVLDEDRQLLFSYYHNNAGNPVKAVKTGLELLRQECEAHQTELYFKGSCSTGYGENLVKAAFRLDGGIVETMAHFMGAKHLNSKVSFILDIGGQDMKAIFIDKGVITRIEINEACSSGCGSFIETFAKTLGYGLEEFTAAACRSAAPCDLGTRCTVFMNSKVKQVMSEGANVDDIAGGLAYSVIKNCLYKVLKLNDVSVLGKEIVVQGGTMNNHAVVRAFEKLTGTEVRRTSQPELMGGYGCALYAVAHPGDKVVSLTDMISLSHFDTKEIRCKGCENQCPVTVYHFDNGGKFFSGNKCERHFSNESKSRQVGENVYLKKYEYLFDRTAEISHPLFTIGIPRCLNMYEEYPFWHTLFTACNIDVRISDPSDFDSFEKSARMVMADNICFPAKLVHSHISNLIAKHVDRIFMPFVVYEHLDHGSNSFNCPIVTGYSEVIKSVQGGKVPIDSPVISFKDLDKLSIQCEELLSGYGIKHSLAHKAFQEAVTAFRAFKMQIKSYNESILRNAREKHQMCILLAGRPYHSDPLIQHRLSEMIASMGLSVLSDDIVREDSARQNSSDYLMQWSFPNRIMDAAKWCLSQDDILFVQLTSFGCGPDAFLLDSIRDIMLSHNKPFTSLKLDDVNNVGSLKLRIRSLVESMKMAASETSDKSGKYQYVRLPAYGEAYRDRKILVPFFTPFISPLIPAIMSVAGYDVDNLPLSDTESGSWGLKYANNEVCYPATLIVGDIIKAFKSGRYDPNKCAIAMSQTGGQCRASSYVPLIRKALIDAGYTDTPVISISMDSTIKTNQPAFKVNWMKVLPVAVRSVLYSDCISKFYHATVVREKTEGSSARLKDLYLEQADGLIRSNRSKELYDNLRAAANDFNELCKDDDTHIPKVGVVGEIFLKFNSFAQNEIIKKLMNMKIEVVPSALTDFFTQAFVNNKINRMTHLADNGLSVMTEKLFYQILSHEIKQVNKIAGSFRYFHPFDDIFAKAESAQQVVSLSAQFGEGWLLAADVLEYARIGVKNIVSLQPFGCIANQIISKGIEKRIKSLIKDIKLLSLDFDSGVSDVNVTNRLLLFTNHLK